MAIASILLQLLLLFPVSFASVSCVAIATDAAAFSRPMHAGWRADKAALIGILCRRTAAQRAAIRRAYAFLYREPLLSCFRYKLSRHYLLTVDFWVSRSSTRVLNFRCVFLFIIIFPVPVF
jgi:hypothetical protein